MSKKTTTKSREHTLPVKHTLTITEARDNIGKILTRVNLNRETYIVTKHGRAIAKIVPIDDSK